MRKLLLSAAAIAALFTGPALSADMPRPVTKAPPAPVAVYNWTGCYVKGGGGYGMWNQDTTAFNNDVRVGSEVRTGGRGWFGTVGGGCDYQLAERWVVGVYGDYDFSNIEGDFSFASGTGTAFGSEKLKSAWAVGGRIGYVLTPAVLTYVSGGFTEARFNRVDLFLPGVPPVAENLSVPRHTFTGWFLGSGFEYNLGWLPGLFWRTEYRFAQYDKDSIDLVTRTGGATALSVDSEKFVQTIRSELVWRFNWSGPVRAGY
jgi:outer membrane immunogenic protein